MGGWLKLERTSRLTPSPHPRCRLRSRSAGEVSAYRSAALFDGQCIAASELGLRTHLFSIHSLQRPNLRTHEEKNSKSVESMWAQYRNDGLIAHLEFGPFWTTRSS